jgi:hypothetical protein
MEQQNPHSLSAIQLKNGLTISFHDRSKPLVGGRWQVNLLISVPLQIERSHFDMLEEPQRTYEAAVQQCGPQIVFEQEKVRNFIEGSEKNNILETLRNDFLASNLNYLENPEFSRRYILKTFQEVDEGRRCREAHLAAIYKIEEER